MNWYRKAKLIDKKAPEGRSVNLQCAYCNRWATHPSDPKATSEEIIWQQYKDLSPEEKADIEELQRNANHISHGICNRCFDILNKIEDIYSIDAQQIGQLSLGLG